MIVGASLRRKEDPRLLTGQGRYADDMRLPGMLHAVVIRSPHAHALIRDIETGTARATPGVALVATAADLGEVGSIPIRLGPSPSLIPFLQPPLARKRVRYVGEPVALVVAADRYIAEDAAERVAVDYGVLPAVASAEQALRPRAPVLHEVASRGLSPLGGNLAARLETVVGDPDRMLAGADVRIRERFTVQRHTGVPLETRGLVASYDADSGRLAVWGPTKVPHFNRRVLAELLGWPVDRIRFVEPDVGGGFGVRGEFYPEDFLIPWAAIRLGRPVKWIEDRREHLMATNHSRQQAHDVEVGATRDGRLLALVDRVVADMGAYLRTHGVTVPELTAALLPGPYRIPHYRCEVSCVVTNKTPTGTYRAPGRYEANFVRERIMDLIAEAVGEDPAEIRRRNFIPPDAMPYSVGTTGLGEPTVYDTGAYASALDAALRAVDYGTLRTRQADARARGRLVGVGLACIVEKAGPGPWEMARVALDPEGRATVYSGAASLGQGLETGLAQICAEELGVSMDDVTVVHGDTEAVSDGIGTWGSRATVVGGSAVLLAARTVKDLLLERAAAWLEAAREDLMIGEGRVWVRGAPSRAVTLSALAAPGATTRRGPGPVAPEPAATMPHTPETVSPERVDAQRATSPAVPRTLSAEPETLYTERDALRTEPEALNAEPDVLRAKPETLALMPQAVHEEPGLSATHVFRVSKMTYPYGTHVAVVEVDPDTGLIEILDYAIAFDVGKAINPRLVEGQLAGGLAQGIGGALLEDLVYDDSGQPLATTFMDYLLPTSMDVPARLSLSVLEETPTPLNPLGAKGAGEGGTAGVGAAIANAVADALRPWGARVRDLPLSPARIRTLTRTRR